MSKKKKGHGKRGDVSGPLNAYNPEKIASGPASELVPSVQNARDGLFERFCFWRSKQSDIRPETAQNLGCLDKLSSDISLLATKEELAGLRSKVEGFADEFRAAIERLGNVQDVLHVVEKNAEAVAEKAKLNARIKELEEQNSKLAEECKNNNEGSEKLLKAMEEVYPDFALSIFGMKRRDVTDGTDKARMAALRLWCNFIDWSEEGDAMGFVNEFRKIDRAVLRLKDAPDIEQIRERIGVAVRDVIAQKIKDRVSVSWDFVGQIIDSAKQFSTGGGQKIVFVKSALISRDGSILEKSEVVCQ